MIIDRDTSVRATGADQFRTGVEGEGLGVGNTVQTSSTGFAEIAFFDGSLTRVDRSGQFTLVDLADAGGARRVQGSLVGGRTWSRVTKAVGPADRFEIDTEVATAAVRGTAFSIDCTAVESCTFTAVEGTILVTPLGGTPITLAAPATVTVQRNVATTSPSPVDPTTFTRDPWIAKNLARDAQATGPTATVPSVTSGTTATSGTTVAGSSTSSPTNSSGEATIDLTGKWAVTYSDPQFTVAPGDRCTAATVTIIDSFMEVTDGTPFCGDGHKPPTSLFLPYDQPLVCKGLKCVALAFTVATDGTLTFPTVFKPKCTPPVAATSTATISSDLRTITLTDYYESCPPNTTYQVSATVILTRL